MNGVYLLIATFIIIAVILITVVLMLIQKHKVKVIKEQLEQLDKEKNNYIHPVKVDIRIYRYHLFQP